MAETAKSPEVREELLWLADSYDRLASDPTANRILEGFRSLEMLEDDRAEDPADRPTASSPERR